MRSTTPVTSFLALTLVILAGSWAPAAAQEASDLNGAWIVTGWSNADGEANPSPQRGLYMFVVTRAEGGNYSMMFVPGSEPRAEFAMQGEATDQEKVAAFDSFVANSGRLIVEFRSFCECHLLVEVTGQRGFVDLLLTTTTH